MTNDCQHESSLINTKCCRGRLQGETVQDSGTLDTGEDAENIQENINANIIGGEYIKICVNCFQIDLLPTSILLKIYLLSKSNNLKQKINFFFEKHVKNCRNLIS